MANLETCAAVLNSFDPDMLAASLRETLQSALFSSRRLITPRRVAQLSREVAESFTHSLSETADSTAVQDFGRRLGEAGLGHTAILALVTRLHVVGWKHSRTLTEDQTPASISYCEALLAGYMEYREHYLLSEQERVRQALDRAQARHSTSQGIGEAG